MRTATIRTNRFVFALLGCLLALLVVVGAACRKQEAPAPSTPEPNPTSGMQTPASNEGSGTVVEPNASEPEAIAATVNGEVITEVQLNAQIDFSLRSDRQLAALPPQFLETLRPRIRTQVLDNLINQVLLLQEAEKAAVTVSDEEVMVVLGELGASQVPPLTVDQIKERLESQGGDFNDLVADYRKGLTLEKFMDQQLAGQAEVSEEEARGYYDAHIADFNQPELVEASHILLGFANSGDPNADSATDPNKIKAEALLAQIKDGADFAESAMANSSDPGSRVRGGQLGYFPREGDMVAPFAEAAFALEPNEVSDVVETPYGYHIIKVTDHRDARVIPFDEAREYIDSIVKGEKQTALVADYLATLKGNATIEYPAASEPEASAPAPTAMTPAPIIRTPRTSEPNAGEGDVIVVEPNMN